LIDKVNGIDTFVVGAAMKREERDRLRWKS